MGEEFPLAEDFSKYSSILSDDDIFTQKINNKTKITTASKVSKQKDYLAAKKSKKHRTKPCIHCRRRKTKCTVSDNENKCVECLKRELDCVFDNETIGSYTHTNKKAKQVESEVVICDSCHHRRTKCIIPKDSESCTECLLRDLSCKFSSQENVKIRNGTPVLDYDKYNGHTILRKTLSLQGPKSAQLQSPNANLEKNLLKFGSSALDSHLSPSAELANEQLIISDSIKLRKINNNCVFKIVKDNEQVIKLTHSQVDEVEKIVHPHGFTLFKVFLRYIHPVIPVIQIDVFFEKYKRSHKEFEPLLLAVVFLHALKLWKHTNLPLEDKPDVDKLERLSALLYSENYANVVPKISACQALVLLMSYSPVSDDLKSITDIETKDDRWEKLSKLINMVEELGLNHDSEEIFTIPTWERKMRKLLSWGIIMIDKFQSLLEFKSSKINPNNWILNELNIQDFQHERGTGFNLELTPDFIESDADKELMVIGNLIFVKMIHLSYHANDCLNEIFNLKSLKFDDFDTLLRKSNNLLNNLNDWFKSLPLNLQTLQMFSGAISTSSLNLSYNLVIFLIYRRIINYFIDNYAHFADIDDSLLKFKFMFKRIVGDLDHFNRSFMLNLTSEMIADCFWYGIQPNSFINIAIVIQLLRRLTKMELYIDDEYTIDDLNDIWNTYIKALEEISPTRDKELLDTLKHIKMFISDS